MTTTITNARVFDGERLLDEHTVVIDGAHVGAVGGPVPSGSTVVDAHGATLLPGLIDAHTHTSVDGLRDALAFGITTELEMMGYWTRQERQEVAARDDIADLRSAGPAISAPGGHPSELMADVEHAWDAPHPGGVGDGHAHDFEMPSASTPDEAAAFVAARVAEDADYIKVMIEEGSVLGHPGLPLLSNATLAAAVREGHRHGKLVIAHVLTAQATLQALAAGVDGLAHVFLDRPHTSELVAAIAASGAFVTPCLCLNSSIMGITGATLAADERVRSRLSEAWLDTLSSSFNTYPQGRLDDVFATVVALHRAGVDLLAGTDVSPFPFPHLGGLAHGVSVHHELRLLVAAGLTPAEALRAATAVPARRFGLADRGRIAPGARADLLLVDGDPTTDIADTLAIRAVWRRGTRLATH